MRLPLRLLRQSRWLVWPTCKWRRCLALRVLLRLRQAAGRSSRGSPSVRARRSSTHAQPWLALSRPWSPRLGRRRACGRRLLGGVQPCCVLRLWREAAWAPKPVGSLFVLLKYQALWPCPRHYNKLWQLQWEVHRATVIQHSVKVAGSWCKECVAAQQNGVRPHTNSLFCTRYRNGDLITHGNGTASLLFGAVVALLSYATLAPYFLKGETNTSRTFGPFTPSRERDVGTPADCRLSLHNRLRWLRLPQLLHTVDICHHGIITQLTCFTQLGAV